MDGSSLSIGNLAGSTLQPFAPGSSSRASDIQSQVAVSSVGSALPPAPPSPTIAQATTSSTNDSNQLKKSAEKLNQNAQPHFGSLQFNVDEGSGKMVLQVIDKETNNVLLQIPSKEALILSETIGRGNTGSLIKESA